MAKKVVKEEIKEVEVKPIACTNCVDGWESKNVVCSMCNGTPLKV